MNRAVLITAEQREYLAANGRQAEARPDFNPYPVVKLFTPDAAATWLLAWTDPEEPDIAYGLCDLGLGFPELGTVRISELERARGKLGLPVERDRHWQAEKSLWDYARQAQRAGHIMA